MKYQHAKKLHNGDEVQDKTTGETVKVLSVIVEPADVYVEGVGSKQGYNKWHHRTVK